MSFSLRKKFNSNLFPYTTLFRSASSVINKAIDMKLQNPALNTVAKRIVTPISSAVFGSAVTHTPPDIQNLAASMIGSAVGNTLGSTLNDIPPVDGHFSDIDDLNLPNIDIDTSDRTWCKKLSEMASEQRQL